MRPIVRFFVWNDMHLRAPNVANRPQGYPFSNEKAKFAVECANGLHGFEPPDFVLSLGDIIDGEIPDYNQDFRFFKEFILDRLSVPFLPCVGNHENGQGEGIPERNIAYDRWFGKEWHNYAFVVGGVAFIVVDTSGAHRLGDEVTERRNSFVERAFERLKDMPIIVATHVPLIAMRDEEVLKASFGFESWKVRDERMLKIVEKHSERVIAVLSGHLHLTGVKWQKGIAHIVPSGTCGYPADFAS
ncbi:MAG: metallophosphoesterase family protein, partial [Armatimonadota bacterium]